MFFYYYEELIGTIPMVTMAQSTANWRNTHTHIDCMHSLKHLHQHVVRSASSAIIFCACWVFLCSVTHQTLTWTTGSLLCVRDHSCACMYT